MLALFLGSAMSELLWGVGSRDPLTLMSVALMFLAVGTLACYLPARRASVTDVADTLRAT